MFVRMTFYSKKNKYECKYMFKDQVALVKGGFLSERSWYEMFLVYMKQSKPACRCSLSYLCLSRICFQMFSLNGDFFFLSREKCCILLTLPNLISSHTVLIAQYCNTLHSRNLLGLLLKLSLEFHQKTSGNFKLFKYACFVTARQQ